MRLKSIGAFGGVGVFSRRFAPDTTLEREKMNTDTPLALDPQDEQSPSTTTLPAAHPVARGDDQ